MRTIVGILIAGIIVLGGILTFSTYYYTAPGPLDQEKTVLFKRGQRFSDIVDTLGEQGVIRYPLLFKAIAAAQGDARKFKAGEYKFSAAITPESVIQMIAKGEVIVHKVTIPEGTTVAGVKRILENEPLLEGSITMEVAEGSILPQTYHFTYGDKRETLLARMQVAMDEALLKHWEKRARNLPVATPEEALILASIIEKETGIPEERPRVAAVFINRLRKGMLLQSDPTVAYGISKDKLERKLTRDDLQSSNPYNTYMNYGLPPTPIANPGEDAIAAVLNPFETEELYFVATGNGGHNFATNLKDHNKNVQAYRKALASQR